MARYHFATRFKGDKMQMIDHWIDSLGSFHLKEIDVPLRAIFSENINTQG